MGTIAYIAIPELQVYRCEIFGKVRDAIPPPLNSSPETVVKTYLNAIQVNDRETAQLLSSSAYDRQVESYNDSPFCNWTSLEGLNISEAKQVSQGYVHVTVRARREQRVNISTVVDAQGFTYWGYFLLKTSNEQWRIVNDGLGV